MEQKTKIHAEEGRNDLIVTREFDLPVELLFKAHADAGIVAQWMGTKVLEFCPEGHGGYRFETTDSKGKILFQAHGVFHDFIPNEKITRTFEMQNSGIGVQIDFLDFEKINDDTSKLTIHSVFRSFEMREKQLKLPFAFGLNMAHDKLEKIVKHLQLES